MGGTSARPGALAQIHRMVRILRSIHISPDIRNFFLLHPDFTLGDQSAFLVSPGAIKVDKPDLAAFIEQHIRLSHVAKNKPSRMQFGQ